MRDKFLIKIIELGRGLEHIIPLNTSFRLQNVLCEKTGEEMREREKTNLAKKKLGRVGDEDKSERTTQHVGDLV